MNIMQSKKNTEVKPMKAVDAEHPAANYAIYPEKLV